MVLLFFVWVHWEYLRTSRHLLTWRKRALHIHFMIHAYFIIALYEQEQAITVFFTLIPWIWVGAICNVKWGIKLEEYYPFLSKKYKKNYPPFFDPIIQKNNINSSSNILFIKLICKSDKTSFFPGRSSAVALFQYSRIQNGGKKQASDIILHPKVINSPVFILNGTLVIIMLVMYVMQQRKKASCEKKRIK